MEKVRSFAEVELPKETQLTLKTMFKAKESLLALYYNAGKLKFDWRKADIHSRETQNWVRESMGCLIEEIFEAEQEIHNELAESIPYQGPKLHLEIREEIADVLHFWIEVFLFSGYTEDDISDYYSKLEEELNLPKFHTDTFSKAMWYGYHIAIKGGMRTKPAGKNLLWFRDELSDKYLLYSIAQLNFARNELKNKYWKSSDKETNKEAYFIYLMEAFIGYTSYLATRNFNHIDLIGDYLTKNIINQERNEKGW